MKPGESLVIMGFLAVMLLILFLLGYIVRRSSTKEKFIFSQKIKNINWRKTFKYWFFIQVFMLLGSMGNNNMYWYEIIGLPIIVMLLIFVNGLGVNTNKEYGQLVRTKDFEDWEKSEERDKKLKKILKKNIF
jgi:uncharacterized membrane protein